MDRLNNAIAAEQERPSPRRERVNALTQVLQAIEGAGSSLGVGGVEEALEALGQAYPQEEESPGTADASEAPGPGLGEEERPEVPSISLPGRFSNRSIPRLLNHLQELMDLAEASDWPDAEFSALDAKVQRMAEAAAEWRDAAQEALENEQERPTPREDRVASLEERAEQLGR